VAKSFLTKIILAIVGGSLIIAGAIFLKSGKKVFIVNSPPPQASAACADIPELPDGISKLATKVIDGDTFLIEGGYSVRILGIDADERDRPCYDPAKNRLEELILNKEVRLEKGTEDKDQWCRYLRYVILGEKNIGLELVEEGMAVARFSPEDARYRDEISAGEKTAKENKTGCKWSAVAGVSMAEEGKTTFSWEKLTTEAVGLKVIAACQAGNYYGGDAIVEGKVADAYKSKTNTTFLNFEKPYPNQCFTGVIFTSDEYKFTDSPEKHYFGKTVRVKGKIKEYQGKPEIILEDPSQIEVGK